MQRQRSKPVIAPESVTPESTVTPESVTPESVTPESAVAAVLASYGITFTPDGDNLAHSVMRSALVYIAGGIPLSGNPGVHPGDAKHLPMLADPISPVQRGGATQRNINLVTVLAASCGKLAYGQHVQRAVRICGTIAVAETGLLRNAARGSIIHRDSETNSAFYIAQQRAYFESATHAKRIANLESAFATMRDNGLLRVGLLDSPDA